MPIANHDEHDPTLPPPGRRWGSGAQSVLPYLTKSLQARPASAPEHVYEARPIADPDTRFSERPPRAE
ncbi:hypothetical protein GCM10028796_46460 [Ramlibacter monticola]|uniref:Uncharacterized protein n=1 Tax=Ramlibacter monticola TaxID=1926872 RepID=A0A937CUY0_9BURK|nr:hypothetical protein [Ramlibacter monticola]MBL0393184.1 hypothetical protein [Ramlibacter monticola]